MANPPSLALPKVIFIIVSSSSRYLIPTAVGAMYDAKRLLVLVVVRSFTSITRQSLLFDIVLHFVQP